MMEVWWKSLSIKLGQHTETKDVDEPENTIWSWKLFPELRLMGILVFTAICQTDNQQIIYQKLSLKAHCTGFMGILWQK